MQIDSRQQDNDGPSLRTLRRLVLASRLGPYLETLECPLLQPSFSQYLNSPSESVEAAEAYRRKIEEILGSLQSIPPPPPSSSLSELEDRLVEVNNKKENEILPLFGQAAQYKGDARLFLSLGDAFAAVSASRAAYLEKVIALERIPPDKTLEGEKLKSEIQTLSEHANLQIHALGLHLYAQRRYYDLLILDALRDYWTRVDRRDGLLEAPRYRLCSYARLRIENSFESDLLAKLPKESVKAVASFLPIRETLSLEKLSSVMAGLMGEAAQEAPSLARLKTRAKGAIEDVRGGVEHYDKLIAEGKTGEATALLSHLWKKGPYQTDVQTIPLEKKHLSDRYIRLVGSISIDLASGSLERLSTSLAEMTSLDVGFHSEGMLSTIRSIRESSDAAVAKATELARSGDFYASKSQIERAASLWPDNPKLKHFATDAFQVGEDAMQRMQWRDEFDRLDARGDYRGIFEGKARFAAAVKADESEGHENRQARLARVIEQCREIDVALKQSSERSVHGDDVLAWEELIDVLGKYPDDKVLTQAANLLRLKITRFLHDIEEAKIRDSRKDYASALTWYLEILHDNPSSFIAKQSTDRLIRKIFNN